MRVSWIGRPPSFTFIVTTVASESSPAGSIFDTLPTSTPAIRTGELRPMFWAFANMALSSNGLVNGTSFEKAKNARTTRRWRPRGRLPGTLVRRPRLMRFAPAADSDGPSWPLGLEALVARHVADHLAARPM